MTDWLVLTRALENVSVAFAIVVAALGLSRGSTSVLAKPLTIMFMCIAVEILLVTAGLFTPEIVRHSVAIIARLIEGAGVAWFLFRLSARNGDQ